MLDPLDYIICVSQHEKGACYATGNALKYF